MEINYSSSTALLPSLFMSAGFILIYIFAYFVIFQNWNPKTRFDAASCAASLIHGTLVLLLSMHTFKNYTSPASKNSETDEMVLDFSIAYFSSDFIHLILFSTSSNFLHITHHIAALYVLVTCRYLVGHAAISFRRILFLAETTSGLMNVYTLAKMAGAERVYKIVSLVFCVEYTVARCVVAPFVLWEMGVYYWRSGGGGGVVPGWVWGSWMAVMWAGLVVCQLWILNKWRVWFKEKNQA